MIFTLPCQPPGNQMPYLVGHHGGPQYGPLALGSLPVAPNVAMGAQHVLAGAPVLLLRMQPAARVSSSKRVRVLSLCCCEPAAVVCLSVACKRAHGLPASVPKGAHPSCQSSPPHRPFWRRMRAFPLFFAF